MNLSEYASYDALGLAVLVRRGEVQASELETLALAAVREVQPKINALAESWPSDTFDREASNNRGPFYGVPFFIKDIAVQMKGKRVELGSRLAEGLTADADSALMRRFRNAGLITLGRTTSPEMAFSTTTEPVLFGVTRNPWDPERSSGGSSGGAGAAVASGIVPLAHGTDAAGSIRVPASFCGVFGLKPTRGRVSNGPNMDEIFSGFGVQLGLSRTVRDSAALLDAIQGMEPGDSYATAPPPHSFLSSVTRDPGKLRIGVQSIAWNGAQPSRSVSHATEQAAGLCRELGHEVEEASMLLGASWEAFVHANTQIWAANLVVWVDDLASAMSRSSIEKFLEPSTLACYEYGRKVSGEDFVRALATRNQVTRASSDYFRSFDVILTPTMPEVAQPLGTYERALSAMDGHAWTHLVFAHAPYSPIANVAGFPAMSVPLGSEANTGLPIGIQFGAAFGNDDLLLSLAGQLERSAPWIDRKPPIYAGRQAPE